MYNLADDPYELHNIIDSVLPAIKHWYRVTLVQMLNCSGTECDHPFGVDDAEVKPDESTKPYKRFKKKKCPFW